jgi:hypothetical protein
MVGGKDTAHGGSGWIGVPPAGNNFKYIPFCLLKSILFIFD